MRTVVTLSLVAMFFASPALGQTNGEPPGDELPSGFNAGNLVSSLGLMSAVIFMSAEIVIATQYGTWLPPAWAWTQLPVGAVPNVIAGLMVAADGNTGLSVANFVAASWLTFNSVLSLLVYEPPPPPKKKPSRSDFLAHCCWWAPVSPLPGGLGAVLGGQF